MTVRIYTDGACSGNPGPGGWGALLRYGDHEKELSGGEPETTNNRMELMAAIMALEALKKRCKVELYTDSVYVRDGITKWLEGWKAKGWRTANKKEVKNQDLWKRLDEAVSRHDVSFHWVKGHAGHPENERADALATGAIRIKNEYIPDVHHTIPFYRLVYRFDCFRISAIRSLFYKIRG